MMLLTNYEGRPGVGLARAVLEKGGPALDAVEAGIRAAEEDESVRSVGRGGTPDLLGRMQSDAAIMDGDTLGAGAVGALSGFLHAITVARRVMEKLPHVMLVGDGAARFAREVRAEPAELLTAKARSAYEAWMEKYVPVEVRAAIDQASLAEYAWTAGRTLRNKGTVVLLARDVRGSIAAGASTSGWANRYPGRLGDSPIIGAGIYADSRFGACGCTHVGEMAIRAGTARSVVLYMKTGMSVQEACQEALRDIGDLRGGFLGPLVVHAIDVYGNPCVLANEDVGEDMDYFYWREDMAEPERRRALVVRPD